MKLNFIKLPILMLLSLFVFASCQDEAAPEDEPIVEAFVLSQDYLMQCESWERVNSSQMVKRAMSRMVSYTHSVKMVLLLLFLMTILIWRDLEERTR